MKKKAVKPTKKVTSGTRSPSSAGLGPVCHTDRGFELVEFKDQYEVPCSLQQSSLADYQQPGISAVWLGCDDAKRMHLDRKQVKALIKTLSKWLKDGTFEGA